MRARDLTQLTADDFALLPETNAHPIELIAGGIVVSPAPRPLHQRIVLRLATLLSGLLTTGDLYLAPIDLKLDDLHVVQPDLLWIAADGRCRVTETRLEGAPDLIIEVLSPSSSKHDQVTKLRLYAAHDVAEYWIADPNGVVHVFSHAEGAYRLVGIFGGG